MDVSDLATYIQTDIIVNKPIWTKIDEMQQKVVKMIVKFVKQAVKFDYLFSQSQQSHNQYILIAIWVYLSVRLFVCHGQNPNQGA